MILRRFIIEREIPAVGTFEREQLQEAAKKSNEVLHQLFASTRRSADFRRPRSPK